MQLRGIPLHIWNEDFFKTMGARLGTFIDFGDSVSADPVFERHVSLLAYEEVMLGKVGTGNEKDGGLQVPSGMLGLEVGVAHCSTPNQETYALDGEQKGDFELQEKVNEVDPILSCA